MQLRVQKTGPRSSIHIIWGIFALLGLLIARVYAGLLPLVPPCIFRLVTGIPCLTCGGTHCLVALAQLDLMASFLYNPLIMLSLIALILLSIGYAIAILIHKRLQIEFSMIEKRFIRMGAILIVAANWAYLIIRMR